MAAEECADAPEPWARFSGLELHEELGRGGMGVVYRAWQSALGRSVAVKILLHARFASAEDRERFRREAQAAAGLRHPGIVAILDFGETDGAPWFSMEHVVGPTLEQRARERSLSPRESARCVARIAEAVAHAHAHGVIHRDLKPANILLDEDSRPRITDFGIARRFEPSGEDSGALTRPGQTLGSPGYAAPELALAASADARTDVYGLGAVLYHLLTGRAPFDGPTLEAVLLQLRGSDPVPPRRFNPALPVDLETICLKCLAKDPDRRYPDASAVADDLERYLSDLPIHARPPGPLRRAWKWSRRNPSAATLLAGLLATLAVIAAGAVLAARREARVEHRASLLSEAAALVRNGHAGSRTTAMQKLEDAWRLRPSAEIRHLAASVLTLPEITFAGTVDPPRDAADGISGDGRRRAVIEAGVLIVRALPQGAELARIALGDPVERFSLDDTGGRVAVCAQNANRVDLIALGDGARIARLEHPLPVTALAWSGELVATACENRFIHIWDTSGNLRHRLSGHESPHIQLAFRPGGQELASTAADHHVRLWHAARGVELLHLEHAHPPYSRLEWSADGRRLLGWAEGGRADAFAVEMGQFLQLLSPPLEEPHSENLGSADLSANGRFAAVIDEQEARLWDFERGRVIARIPKLAGQWLSARFSPDGSELLTCGWAEPLATRSLVPHESGVWSLSPAKVLAPGYGQLLRTLSPDGRFLVLSNNRTGQFSAFDRTAGAAVSVAHADTLAVALAPDGTWMATSSYSKPGLRAWKLPEAKHVAELCPEEIVMQLLAVGPDRLIAKTAEHLRFIDARTWQETRPPFRHPRLRGLAPSRDGRWLAAATDTEIRILNSDTLEERLRLLAPAHAGWLGECDIAFDADASHLLVHTALGSVLRWDLERTESELATRGFIVSQNHRGVATP